VCVWIFDGLQLVLFSEKSCPVVRPNPPPIRRA